MNDFFADLETHLRAAHARDTAPRRRLAWLPTRPRMVAFAASAVAAAAAIAILVGGLATRTSDRGSVPASPAGDCSRPPQIDLATFDGPKAKLPQPEDHLHPKDPRVLRAFLDQTRKAGDILLAPAWIGSSCSDARPAVCAIVAATGDHCVSASEVKVGALVSESRSKDQIEQYWLVPDGVRPHVVVDGRAVAQDGTREGNVFHVTLEQTDGDVTLSLEPLDAILTDGCGVLEDSVPDRIKSELSVFDKPPDPFDPEEFSSFDDDARPFRDGGRIVRRHPDGSKDWLFAVAPVGPACEAGPPLRDGWDVCVLRHMADGMGHGGTCASLEKIRAGRAFLGHPGRDGAAIHVTDPFVIGIVPDGVTGVDIALDPPIHMDARDNLVEQFLPADVRETIQDDVAGAPRRFTGPSINEAYRPIKECPAPTQVLERFSIFQGPGTATRDVDLPKGPVHGYARIVGRYVVAAVRMGDACEEADPGVCLGFRGARLACTPLDEAERRGVLISSDREMAVLVPDGVTQVRLACSDGADAAVSVRDNVARLQTEEGLGCARVVGLD